MDWDNFWSVPQLSVRPDSELLVRFLGTVIAIALLRMSLSLRLRRRRRRRVVA